MCWPAEIAFVIRCRKKNLSSSVNTYIVMLRYFRSGLDQASAVCDRKYFVDGRRLCHTSSPASPALLILSPRPLKGLGTANKGQTNMVERVMESSPYFCGPLSNEWSSSAPLEGSLIRNATGRDTCASNERRLAKQIEITTIFYILGNFL